MFVSHFFITVMDVVADESARVHPEPTVKNSPNSIPSRVKVFEEYKALRELI